MERMNSKIYFFLIAFVLTLTAIVVLIYDFCDIYQKSENSLKSNEIIDKKLSESDDRLIVKTLSGALVGKKLNVFNDNIYAFVGIPYAEPPTGQLRFSSPQPVKKWSGLKSALNFTAMCPQVIIPNRIVEMNYITKNVSEDCLSLNIWTPDIKPKKLKTVMVWIHGGGFLYNSANIHEKDGRVLSSFGDVVVVTINYR